MRNTLFYSIFWNKCPKCRQGDLFLTSPFQYKTFDHMHDKCEHCHQSFNPEPGFYYGAMYISYAFQVALVVSILVATYILNLELEIKWYFVILISFLIVLFTKLFRWSRSIWLHINVRYDANLNH